MRRNWFAKIYINTRRNKKMKQDEKENDRKKIFIDNWPFYADFDKLWEGTYECIHCGRRGLYKNYRTEKGENITYILCEYEGCDGSAIDMIPIDPDEPEYVYDPEEAALSKEINSFTSKEDVQKTIQWFKSVLDDLEDQLEKWIDKAELGVNTTVENKRQLNTDHHKENCELLKDYLKSKKERDEDDDDKMSGNYLASEFIAVKLCHEVLCIHDPRMLIITSEDFDNPMI